jgi:hypothetical protein
MIHTPANDAHCQYSHKALPKEITMLPMTEKNITYFHDPMNKTTNKNHLDDTIISIRRQSSSSCI